MNFTNEQLQVLLQSYQDELEHDDLVYILACEEYEVFHDFMYAANRDADSKAQRRLMGQQRGRGGQGSSGAAGAGGNVTEEELIQQAINESMRAE